MKSVKSDNYFFMIVCIFLSYYLLNCSTATAPEEVERPDIYDLKVVISKPTSAVLTWTAPNQSSEVTPYRYEMRYDTLPITNDTEWFAATVVDNVPNPASGGTREEFEITGLTPKTNYYLRIRIDEILNKVSRVSNGVLITTADTSSFFEFYAPDLYGDTLHSRDLLGEKLTVINFWGVWCGYCIQEMPDLLSLHYNFIDSGVQIVGYNRGDTQQRARDYAEQAGLPWTNLMVPIEAVRAYGVTGYPTTFFLDSLGNQVGVLRGRQTYERFRDAVNYLLGEID